MRAIQPGLLVLGLLCALAPCASAQDAASCASFDTFLAQVQAADASGKSTIVDAFISCVGRSVPVIESSSRPEFSRVIFVFRGDARQVTVAGDMTGLMPTLQMTPIAGTDLFWAAVELPSGARLEYRLHVDRRSIPDPLNSRVAPGSFASNSFFAMPDYRAPEELQPPAGSQRGTVEELPFQSDILKNRRTVRVYLPTGYTGSQARFPVLYVHDGDDYLELTRIHEVTDSLIARGMIAPLIVVLVPSPDRLREYTAKADFARAFATELVPLIDRRYRTIKSREGRGMLGGSLGGFASVHAVGLYSDVFSKLAIQSTTATISTPFERLLPKTNQPLQIHMDVGIYEANFYGADYLAGNQRLRELFQQAGYSVEYVEVPEGHNWTSWRARLPMILKFFWGR